jgi:hypothetical protein
MPVHDWTRVFDGIFHHFHHEWLSTLSRTLNAGLLPPDYYAMADQFAGGRGPDVLALENVSPSPEQSRGDEPENNGASGNGIIALATAPPQVRFTATSEAEWFARKHKAIAIRHRSGDRVVAIVEIVSPGNRSNRHGLRSFIEKTVEFLEAGIHLLIIDLFPPTTRDPQGIHGAIWSEIADDSFRLPEDKPLTLVAYSAGELKTAYIEPVAVGDVLPDMPLFLEPDKYINVPLEATYQAAFDAVPRRWRDVLQPPAS